MSIALEQSIIYIFRLSSEKEERSRNPMQSVQRGNVHHKNQINKVRKKHTQNKTLQSMLYCLSSGYRFIKSYTFLQSLQASPVFQRVIDCLTSCFFSLFVFPSLRPQSVQRWQKKTFAKFVIYWFAIGDKFAVRGISFPSDCARRLMDFLAHFFCRVTQQTEPEEKNSLFVFDDKSEINGLSASAQWTSLGCCCDIFRFVFLCFTSKCKVLNVIVTCCWSVEFDFSFSLIDLPVKISNSTESERH